MLKKIKKLYNKHKINHYVINYLNQNTKLKNLIDEISAISDSTGTSLSDYVILYEYIRRNKPKFVLECGTGISTYIMAQAMKDFVLPHSPDAKLVSMDDQEEWFNHQVSIFPERFKDFVELRYSPIDSWSYSFVIGTVYKDVPDYPYEFVFVDGPSQGPIEQVGAGVTMCNMDFVRVVANSDSPITGIIDNRKHTILAYTNIFGPQKVSLFSNYAFGLVQNVSKTDMILGDKTKMIKRVFPYLVKYNKKSIFKYI